MNKIGIHLKAVGQNGKKYMVQAQSKGDAYVCLIYNEDFDLIEVGSVQYRVPAEAVKHGLCRVKVF